MFGAHLCFPDRKKSKGICRYRKRLPQGLQCTYWNCKLDPNSCKKCEQGERLDAVSKRVEQRERRRIAELSRMIFKKHQ